MNEDIIKNIEDKKEEEQKSEISASPIADETKNDWQEKLAACEAKRDEYLAGWQRAKADFINHKKEESNRLQEIVRYSQEELLRELIAVIDSFNLGIAALEKAGPVEKGIYMIRVQLEDVLKRWGLERIKVEVGKMWNPAQEEAIGEQESGEPPGTVLEEIEPGYRLHDKVVRPARVRIAKSKAD